MKTTFIIISLIMIGCANIPAFCSSDSALKTASDQNEHVAIRLDQIQAPSFSRPVYMLQAPDNNEKFYVLEQRGKLKQFAMGQNLAKEVCQVDVERGSEKGLLGMAFHPNYGQGTDRRFYLYMSVARNGRGSNHRSVVNEYSMKIDGTCDLNSKKEILSVDQPFSNHNGGQISFGPDGMLYIGLGDGGAAGDPQRNGQNKTTLLGSILRIDVSRDGAGKNYAIPSDNPFALTNTGESKEIFAFGLRNPWRFSFDRETGELWAGDVGQGDLEEIDIIKSGQNYGWNIREGSREFNRNGNCRCVGPVVEYSHTNGGDGVYGASVTGGYVYRGSEFPGLKGTYFFADFVVGNVFSTRKDAAGRYRIKKEMSTNYQISSFAEANDGRLFVISYEGKILKLNGAQ